MISIATKRLRCHQQNGVYFVRHVSTMNRARNRQPRQGGNGKRQTPRNQPRSSYGDVPNSQQVIPGASVSIVLKQDQATGRETQGVVQDLLSRGNHPRGIKVRLKDGQIGRVQRMVNGELPASVPITVAEPVGSGLWWSNNKGGSRDAEDTTLSGPPPRTLSDFIPNFQESSEAPDSSLASISFSSATIKCPICEAFEGDEAAVSHHVEQEH
jgi:uncharacterized repeat protein (TIGR03833 family)